MGRPPKVTEACADCVEYARRMKHQIPRKCLCKKRGRMDDNDDHRDEDNFTVRCPEADALERTSDEPVYLREL